MVFLQHYELEVIWRNRVQGGPLEGDLARRTTAVPPRVQCKVQNIREMVAESMAKKTTRQGGAEE